MTKLTDYGIMLLTHFARQPDGSMYNARDLAAAAGLPVPTVGKILKMLAREDLLVSHRGSKGGYSLARQPHEISVAEIIGALEGPVGLTECSVGPGTCDQESRCPTRSNWNRINRVVLEALKGITLSEMTTEDLGALPAARLRGRPARAPAQKS